MTKKTINLGTGPNSSTGDTLREAFEKVNDNFSELYSGDNLSSLNVTVNQFQSTSSIVETNIQVRTGNVIVGNSIPSGVRTDAEQYISVLGDVYARNFRFANSGIMATGDPYEFLPIYTGNIQGNNYTILRNGSITNSAEVIVTDANGNIVTDANGNVVTNIVANLIIDANGNILASYGNITNVVISNANIGNIFVEGNITSNGNIFAQWSHTNLVNDTTTLTISSNIAASQDDILVLRAEIDANAGEANIFTIDHRGNITTAGFLYGNARYLEGLDISTVGNIDNSFIARDDTRIQITTDEITDSNGNIVSNDSIITVSFQNLPNAVIISGNGNIVANGNITSNYFLGNGRLLTGIDTTLIGRANTNVKINEDEIVTISSDFGDNIVIISNGNITAFNFIGNVVGELTGNVTGNLTGDVTGNVVGNITGNVTGNLTGDVTGNVVGDLTGNLTGDVTGNIVGNITGNIVGDVIGNLTGNVSGDEIITNLVTVNGNVTANTILADFGEFNNDVDISNNLTVGNFVTINGGGVVTGNWRVQGTLTTVNQTQLVVENLFFKLANSAVIPSDADGAGMFIDVANASISYDWYTDTWVSNKDFKSTGNLIAEANVVAENYFGNIRNAVGGYNDSNVFAYLPTHTGNVGADTIDARSVILSGNTTGLVVSSVDRVGIGQVNSGAIIADGGIAVTGNVIISGYGSVTGTWNTGATTALSVTAQTRLIAQGNLTVGTTIVAGGSTTTQELIVNANATIGGNVSADYFIGNIVGNIIGEGADFSGNLSADNITSVTNLTVGNDASVVGNITAGNISVTGQIDNYATLAYVDTTIANLIGSAPSTLDTLAELANALSNNDSFSTTVTQLIGNNAANITIVQGNIATLESNVITLEGNIATLESNVDVIESNIATLEGNIVSLENTLADQTLDINTGNLVIRETITFANDAIVAGNIIPASNAVYSLGSATSTWKDLYVSTNTIYINGVPISVNAENQLVVDQQAVLSSNSSADFQSRANIVTSGNIEGENLVANAVVTDFLTVANNVNVIDNIRNRVLLTGGFLLTEGTVDGTRTPYVGNVIGESDTTYWFDSADDSWYDANVGGTRLVGF